MILNGEGEKKRIMTFIRDFCNIHIDNIFTMYTPILMGDILYTFVISCYKTDLNKNVR